MIQQALEHGRRVSDEDDSLAVSLWSRRRQLPDQIQACLTPAEAKRAQMYESSRRQGFVSGRYLAKRQILQYHGVNVWENFEDSGFQRIEILPDESSGHSRPVVRLNGASRPWSLSVSHTDWWTAVALSFRKTRVGIDVVELNTTRRISNLWFSSAEQKIIRTSQSPAEAPLILWSVKEALFKTSEQAVPFAPRDWETELDNGQLTFLHQGHPYSAKVSLLRYPNRLAVTVAAMD